jgi:hypothetical protein
MATSLTLLQPFNIDTANSFTFANVTITSNVTSNNAILGNLVTANYFTGNGSLLTGLPASYANSNVASYLPTYAGGYRVYKFTASGSITF